MYLIGIEKDTIFQIFLKEGLNFEILELNLQKLRSMNLKKTLLKFF